MLLVLIFLAFAFSLCDANNFVCQYHDEHSKSLEIYCDYFQKQLPRNCVPANPSLNSSDVIRLKIEGCNPTDVCNISERFETVQQLDISYSAYGSFNCSDKVFENLIDFNASHNELTAIPTAILQKFQMLETLDLSHNYVMRIFSGDFGNFGQNLRQINLAHNNLAFIDDRAFVNFRRLELIDLNYNRLSTLPKINHLHSIRDVSIQENPELITFDCKFMSSMEHQRRVNLSWQYITAFDGGKNCHIQRSFRAYQSNRTESVYHSFGHHYHLFCNENGFNHIQSFVAGTQAFKNVRPTLRLLNPSVLKIDLSDNSVDELDAALFARFQRLNELILSNIRLIDFDFDVLNVNHQISLDRLDISQNNLKMVKNPMLLQNFENLIDFNAAGNRIENTDEIIRYLPAKIRRLNLAGCHVGNINAIERLTALEYLNLSGTNLSIIIGENPFVSLRHLISLDISHNNLSNVNFAVSKHLSEFPAVNHQIKNASEIISSLMIPSMDSSEITLDHSDPFQILSNLTYLNISGTNLRKFELKSIEPLKWLHTLDISQNQLKSIDLEALPHFTQLERLYLNDNELTILDNFVPNASPKVSLAIDKNYMPCVYLRQLKYEHPNINYIGDQLNQKHSNNCRSSTQAISDFLGTVYDTVKIW